MLTARERRVMSIIYGKCFGRGGVLISPAEILEQLPEKAEYNATDLAKILKDLAYDGYIDVVETDRKGEFFYCINLMEKGSAFPREMKNQRRTLLFRLALSGALAVFSFLIGLILKNIF